MSPDQGPEALLEGSKRDSDYQTVSKLDKLIVEESSGSTRRIQRAQEHRIPTSLSQKIISRTVYDQGIEYRSSVHNHSLFPRIYKRRHSKKPINRASFLLEKGFQNQSLKRSRERSKTALAPLLLLDHRRNFVGRPPEGPILRRTTT
ncbi:hypothetical protein M5K25_023823 [Dendrobium thyrsiflorum]|uniref:Uncharacterized protein n=1 Tax=Dendrobium thyrsiflorum TaxID=117978 RepID=A0ABD0U095_DENTH